MRAVEHRVRLGGDQLCRLPGVTHRFQNSPGAEISLATFDTLMDELGYDRTFTSTAGNSPATIGNRIGQTVIAFGLGDGSNEAGNHADTTGYTPVNPPMDVTQSGTTMSDPNRWQPLIVEGQTQVFLTPHWGDVTPFAMERAGADDVYHDPGTPPQLAGEDDAEFKEAVVRVIRFSSVLDPGQGVVVNRSPRIFGNNLLGTNDGTGHDLNPTTGQPYEDNFVNLGDWGRVLAEFWADGPNSETPPGHWNTIANHVTDRMEVLGIAKRIGGRGPVVDDLEWDAKLYFALNGAVHDAGIAAWDAKVAYDYVRPISMIRFMGGLGQSSDPEGPSFHPNGLPLQPGLIEVVTSETTASGRRHEHLAGHEGEVAIFAWAGHPDDPDGLGGVEWILAEDWLPYQAADFVTPPFAAFISGHSAFSRASAEVLTLFTGDPFFPGGMATFTASRDEFLKFEGGPSQTVELQWATYFDASDEAGLSRLYGGIHVDADDLDGRVIGSQVGMAAYHEARRFFHDNRTRRGGRSGASATASRSASVASLSTSDGGAGIPVLPEAFQPSGIGPLQMDEVEPARIPVLPENFIRALPWDHEASREDGPRPRHSGLTQVGLGGESDRLPVDLLDPFFAELSGGVLPELL